MCGFVFDILSGMCDMLNGIYLKSSSENWLDLAPVTPMLRMGKMGNFHCSLYYGFPVAQNLVIYRQLTWPNDAQVHPTSVHYVICVIFSFINTHLIVWVPQVMLLVSIYTFVFQIQNMPHTCCFPLENTFLWHVGFMMLTCRHSLIIKGYVMICQGTVVSKWIKRSLHSLNMGCALHMLKIVR